MLTLAAAGAEQLWDELLPLEVKQLPAARLKGHEGQQIWTGWGTLTYNLDTYTRLT